MYLLTLEENPNEGAYAVADRYGEKVNFVECRFKDFLFLIKLSLSVFLI